MHLNVIKDNYGARYKSKRLGRGIGSGKGKTCARGGKGQTARSGVALNGFEGGQMPLYIRLPKRGFTSINKTTFFPINLHLLEALVARGLLDPQAVTIEALKKIGLLKGHDVKVKLLGHTDVKTKFNIMLHAISAKAKKNIESVGGVFSAVK